VERNAGIVAARLDAILKIRELHEEGRSPSFPSFPSDKLEHAESSTIGKRICA
jgi:hypothetical protein